MRPSRVNQSQVAARPAHRAPSDRQDCKSFLQVSGVECEAAKELERRIGREGAHEIVTEFLNEALPTAPKGKDKKGKGGKGPKRPKG